jgi:hypothetical protein
MKNPHKPWILVITSLLLLCSGSLAEDLIPKSFPSIQAAKAYAETSFAGGKTETFSVNGKEIMVLVIYGSGVPDLAIAANLKKKGNWQFVAEGNRLGPTVTHTIKQEDNKLMIYGDPTNKPSLLLRVEAPTNSEEITAQQPSSQP